MQYKDFLSLIANYKNKSIFNSVHNVYIEIYVYVRMYVFILTFKSVARACMYLCMYACMYKYVFIYLLFSTELMIIWMILVNQAAYIYVYVCILSMRTSSA